MIGFLVTESVYFHYSRSCLRSNRSYTLFFGGLTSEQLSFFRNVQPAFFGKILLRTDNCIGVLPFVVNCQEVQCSTQTEGDTSELFEIHCVWLVFCFRGTLHSVFCQFVNCVLTGITSLNITTQCRTQTRDPNTIHVMNTHGPLGSLVDPRTITLNEDSPGDDLWGLTKRQSFSEKFYWSTEKNFIVFKFHSLEWSVIANYLVFSWHNLCTFTTLGLSWDRTRIELESIK